MSKHTHPPTPTLSQALHAQLAGHTHTPHESQISGWGLMVSDLQLYPEPCVELLLCPTESADSYERLKAAVSSALRKGWAVSAWCKVHASTGQLTRVTCEARPLHHEVRYA